MNLRRVLVMLALITLPLHAGPARAEMAVHFIDVGQGGSVLLERYGEAVLFDCGTHQAGATVVKYLADAGVDHLALLVVSHAHDDHMGGCLSVLAAVTVDRVVHNGSRAQTAAWRGFLRQARTSTTVEAIERPERALAWARLLVPWSARGARFSLEADNSLALMATDGAVTILLTGDCEVQCERVLAGSKIGAVTVLLAGHHGSAASSTGVFLRSVKPRIAVIQSGAGNPYGHPTPAALRRLTQAGAIIYRTDQHGSLIVTSNGRTVEVEGSR